MINETEDLHEYPSFVHIETTNACNLSCAMCGNKSMKRLRRMISWVVFDEVVSQLEGWPVHPTVLLHTVGEPLLHPLCLKMAKRIRDTRCALHLYTNGTHFDKELFLYVLSIPENKLTISLGLINHCNKNGRALNIIRILDELYGENIKGEITIRAICEDFGQKQLPCDLVNAIKKLGALTEITSEGNQGGQNPRKRNGYFRPEAYDRICRLPFVSLVVYNDGKLGYCVVDFDAALASSFYVKDGLKSFWDSEIMQSVRKAHTDNLLQGTICEFCSSRHSSWNKFKSIYEVPTNL